MHPRHGALQEMQNLLIYVLMHNRRKKEQNGYIKHSLTGKSRETMVQEV